MKEHQKSKIYTIQSHQQTNKSSANYFIILVPKTIIGHEETKTPYTMKTSSNFLLETLPLKTIKHFTNAPDQLDLALTKFRISAIKNIVNSKFNLDF